jgi:hypothetical protein
MGEAPGEAPREAWLASEEGAEVAADAEPRIGPVDLPDRNRPELSRRLLPRLADRDQRHDLSQLEIVLTVISVNLIMLVLLEVPLIGYVVAPQRTVAAIERGEDWLALNGARAVTIGFTVIGIALIVRGLIYASG